MTPEEPHNEPRPIPRPGPRPGPKPTPRPHPHQAPGPPANAPHRFGRVDADGTVWLIGAAGERIIGSWQAGDTEAAFAHFGRRFDDLSTEVALMEERLGPGTGDAPQSTDAAVMEERLSSGTGDARKIKATAAGLTETLPTANVLGDVDALAARLASIGERAELVAAAQAPRPAGTREAT